jgi:NADH-quinone oxidoreductase subunit N
MLLLMLSMAGVPPTAGFYAKLLVIQAVIDVKLIWLAILSVLIAVIGAYYYLRVIKLMYFDPATEQAPLAVAADVRVLIGVNALALVAIVPWVGSLLELCRAAIRTFAP